MTTLVSNQVPSKICEIPKLWLEVMKIRRKPTWYHSLQGVNKVLQVDVISVCFDVCQEEIVDPFSDLTLKNHSQHSRRQLQEEDEADDA